ncbi:MAG: LPS export ABC transporter permease LptG [Hyphomicrobiaceae bacterium]
MKAPRTLRRYIGLRFLTAILGAFFLCALLIFMIDIVELLRQAGKFGRVGSLTITKMALLRLPSFTELLLPFCVLAGSIGALLVLNRKSELAVMRASGMSAFQFVRPGVIVAFILGVLAVTAYNPLAAHSRETAEKMFAKAFGREMSVLRAGDNGAWLRQDGKDGASVLHARAASTDGRTLHQAMFLQYDKQGRFVERVDARRAQLHDGYWEVEDATVNRMGERPQKYEYFTISTYLSPERVADALGKAVTVSFWDLPGLIETTEKAGLSAERFRVQYAQLLMRPFLLVVMVLLAATVSLRSFRSGGIQIKVALGLIGGFGFFLFSEISRQIGVAGLAPPMLAVVVPVFVGFCGAFTVLLHQEDG